MRKNHDQRKLCKNDGMLKHSVAGILVRYGTQYLHKMSNF